MKIDGGCHCGAITYEAEVDPDKVVLCHCTDCQTLSGSAFRTVVPTNEGTFKLLSGEPKVYVKTGESGNKREQTFCADCGTPISYEHDELPGEIYIHAGLFDEADRLVPDRHAYVTSKLFWMHLEDGLDTPGAPGGEGPASPA